MKADYGCRTPLSDKSPPFLRWDRVYPVFGHLDGHRIGSYRQIHAGMAIGQGEGVRGSEGLESGQNQLQNYLVTHCF